MHLSRVIFGQYSFYELMEHAINQISLKGNIYPSYDLKD